MSGEGDGEINDEDMGRKPVGLCKGRCREGGIYDSPNENSESKQELRIYKQEQQDLRERQRLPNGAWRLSRAINPERVKQFSLQRIGPAIGRQNGTTYSGA